MADKKQSDDHEQRVLKAIKSGYNRPTLIEKQTCLGPANVAKALSSLRKLGIINKIEGGKYEPTDCSA